MYLYKQHYTIINQNRQKHIPLNARSWNDLNRSLDGNLKNTNNRNWASLPSKKHRTMAGLFNHAKFIGYHQYVPNKIVIKIFISIEFGTVLLLSANTGQCQIQNFHFSKYLIGGGNVL